MTSLKTTVIEHLFWHRHDPVAGVVSPDVVTFDDIVQAIRDTRVALSTSNPANFWKDIIRTPNADSVWPEEVLRAGFTGDDAIGSTTRACFRFVKLPPGQTTAFPPPPTLDEATLRDPWQLESLSLSPGARRLGREDDAWLAQVAQRLRIVETHFALTSGRDVSQLEFLQAGIRLPTAVVDLAHLLVEASGKRWLVAAECKGRRDSVWIPQIARTATAFAEASSSSMGVAGVIPFAIKVIGPSLVQTVEFAPSQGSTQLQVRSQAAMRLIPPVPGIG
jgi:hypothetical protein